jgi:FkbM family methyltransferase
MDTLFSPSETTLDDEYQLADVTFYPGEHNYSLVHAKSTNATCILHGVYVNLLKHCREFKTLDEHLYSFCQGQQISKHAFLGLRHKLQNLAQNGYFLSRRQFHTLDEQTSPSHIRFEETQNVSGIMCKLPNGLSIVQPSISPIAVHTLFIYEEIFQNEIYLKHGIALTKGDCIFDVGANIGLFSLFVHQKCREAIIYAFEPITYIFNLLHTNIHFHGIQAKLFNCGLSDHAQTASFTSYPVLSGLSGRSTDEESTRNFIKLIVKHCVKDWTQEDPSRKDNTSLVEHTQTSLERYFLHSETYTCPLKTLSEVIREHDVEHIDLLKVDAEKSEIDVLTGIEEEDWSKIKQIALEAHSQELTDTSIAILQQHGFKVSVDLYQTLEGWEPCHMIYGIRRQ